VGALFDELVYGKRLRCCRKGRRAVTLYLNEDVPELLVAAVEGDREVYLNLRETQAVLSSSRHEVEHGLVPD
jgi:hypothetical protein